jgi:hypothetical protein
VLRAWQKRLWQIVGNHNKDLVQSIFMAMHGTMKTGNTEAISFKCAMQSQLDTRFAAKIKKSEGSCQVLYYVEYRENKLGMPDLHKQRIEILCVLRPTRDVKLTTKAHLMWISNSRCKATRHCIALHWLNCTVRYRRCFSLSRSFYSTKVSFSFRILKCALGACITWGLFKAKKISVLCVLFCFP